MKTILILIIMLTVLSGCGDKEQLSKEQISGIERMVDNRDPKTIAGSFWTSQYDCTYKNPPRNWILLNAMSSCEMVQHNLVILRRGGVYFIPRSTADNNPPYCIIEKSGSGAGLDILKGYEKLYCDKK